MTKFKDRAEGTFEVKLTPEESPALPPPVDGVALGRFVVTKQFAGDLQGAGAGTMLSAGGPVKGSAGYVLIERVTGTLAGRAGSFVLQHNGLMNRGAPELSIVVVPDSGTGELAGISGRLTIAIDNGKHSYSLEYSL